MKTYNCTAVMTTDLTLEVEADNLVEARIIAEDCAEAGVWNESEGFGGEFKITEIMEKE